MADLSDNTNWFETDASNNKGPPNGWPEGMMPSAVNDTARSDKGALKRFWDRINPVQTVVPASGIWTFVTGNPAYPTAYVDGEVYSFTAGSISVGGDQFQVNALPAKPIWKRIFVSPFWTPIIAQDIFTSLRPQLVYDTLLNSGAGAFILLNPFVPIYGDGAGGISASGGLVVAGNGVFGQALTVNSGGAHITGGVFCDGAVINGGLTVNNPFISCQNIDASNDVAAHGVFRRESVALGGPRGARIECYGGDWDFMTFVMNGGYLQISPDSGASGYTLQPVSGFSDARLKENIRDAEIDALAALCDLTLRTFEWNEKAAELMPWRSGGTVPCGLVAQELQATIPYAVSELPSSDMLHVHNDYLVPYLIRAIQQLTERVVQLEHVVSV